MPAIPVKVTPANNNQLKLDPDPVSVPVDASAPSTITWQLSGATDGDQFTGFCWLEPPDTLPDSGIFTDPTVTATVITIYDRHTSKATVGTEKQSWCYVINANIGGQIYSTRPPSKQHEGIASTQDGSIRNN